jgi:hypothetical protein
MPNGRNYSIYLVFVVIIVWRLERIIIVLVFFQFSIFFGHGARTSNPNGVESIDKLFGNYLVPSLS